MWHHRCGLSIILSHMQTLYQKIWQESLYIYVKSFAYEIIEVFGSIEAMGPLLTSRDLEFTKDDVSCLRRKNTIKHTLRIDLNLHLNLCWSLFSRKWVHRWSNSIHRFRQVLNKQFELWKKNAPHFCSLYGRVQNIKLNIIRKILGGFSLNSRIRRNQYSILR